jgi:hypothetical protein
MHNLIDLGPLFQWAISQDTRNTTPRIIRRIALRGQISELHAKAFCEANSIGPVGAR